MKKKDLQEKLFQLRLTRDEVENEIRELEYKADPVLKNGFYVAKYKDDEHEFADVFHVFDGNLHALNCWVETSSNATKAKIIREISQCLFNNQKISFKKVPAQEAISYLKG